MNQFIVVPLSEEDKRESEEILNYLKDNLPHEDIKVEDNFYFKEGNLTYLSTNFKKFENLIVISVGKLRNMDQIEKRIEECYKFHFPSISVIPIVFAEEDQLPTLSSQNSEFPFILIGDKFLNNEKLDNYQKCLFLEYLIESVPYLIKDWRQRNLRPGSYLVPGISGALVESDELNTTINMITEEIRNEETNPKKEKIFVINTIIELPDKIKEEINKKIEDDIRNSVKGLNINFDFLYPYEDLVKLVKDKQGDLRDKYLIFEKYSSWKFYIAVGFVVFLLLMPIILKFPFLSTLKKVGIWAFIVSLLTIVARSFIKWRLFNKFLSSWQRLYENFAHKNDEEIRKEINEKFDEWVKKILEKNLEDVFQHRKNYSDIAMEKIKTQLFTEPKEELLKREHSLQDIRKYLEELKEEISEEKSKNKPALLRSFLGNQIEDLVKLVKGKQEDLRGKYLIFKKYSSWKFYITGGFVVFLLLMPIILEFPFLSTLKKVGIWAFIVSLLTIVARFFIKWHLFKNFLSHWRRLKNEILDSVKKSLEKFRFLLYERTINWWKIRTLGKFLYLREYTYKNVEKLLNFWNQPFHTNLHGYSPSFLGSFKVRIILQEEKREEIKSEIIKTVYAKFPESENFDKITRIIFKKLKNSIISQTGSRGYDCIDQVNSNRIKEWIEKARNTYTFFSRGHPAEAEIIEYLLKPSGIEISRDQLVGINCVLQDWDRKDAIVLISLKPFEVANA